MKLSRLQSVANNAVRDSIWTPKPAGYDPLSFHAPSEVITVNLKTGTITPERDGDSVEEYYSMMSRWFHDVLEKEGIPLDVIESAILTITPNREKKCIIIAQGRRFESSPV
ncbi:MAG: hypothetical protein ACW99U_03415 [Candidatus Thorarchaeota archaeon]|jgi:hypothetical protein